VYNTKASARQKTRIPLALPELIVAKILNQHVIINEFIDVFGIF
jgi:hypothetical protein